MSGACAEFGSVGSFERSLLVLPGRLGMATGAASCPRICWSGWSSTGALRLLKVFFDPPGVVEVIPKFAGRMPKTKKHWRRGRSTEALEAPKLKKHCDKVYLHDGACTADYYRTHISSRSTRTTMMAAINKARLEPPQKVCLPACLPAYMYTFYIPDTGAAARCRFSVRRYCIRRYRRRYRRRGQQADVEKVCDVWCVPPSCVDRGQSV